MIGFTIVAITVFLAVFIGWLIKLLFDIDKQLDEILVTLHVYIREQRADTYYSIDILDHLNKTPYKHSKNR